MRARAAVMHAPRAPLSVQEVTPDPPRAGEVLVRVAAAGEQPAMVLGLSNLDRLLGSAETVEEACRA